MTRHSRIRAGIIASFAFLIVASIWLRAQLHEAQPVSELMPPGALIYLEAKDFKGLLNDWNGSTEKSRWLASANYSVLAQSRLLQRLSQAEGEFATFAGVPIGMPLLDQLAGGRSGFAFYDLSALTFVYLTEQPQSRLESIPLWRERGRYTRREAAGIPFYTKSGEGGTRTVAFSSFKGWFVVATNDDLMAQTLTLLSGRKDPSLATEPWFQQAVKQSSGAGDLRLVYNLSALIRTPQFRTYWLQRNVSELKPFTAGISDLFRRNDVFEEQREMLRSTEIPATANDSSFQKVLAYAPPSGSLFRAWTMPDRATLTETLQQVILGERPLGAAFNAPAPQVTLEAGNVGSEADLEIRIDEPPFRRAAEISITPVVDAVLAMQPTAALHVQTTRVLRDQVFVMPNSGLVLVCKQLDRAALDRALAQVTTPLTAGNLDPLHVSLDGDTVLLTRLDLSRNPSAIVPPPSGVTYAAVYNHSAEWPHYKELFAILDRTPTNPEGPVSPNTPAFFSANVQSLGDSLPRLQNATIFSSDEGSVVRETVRYRWARP